MPASKKTKSARSTKSAKSLAKIGPAKSIPLELVSAPEPSPEFGQAREYLHGLRALGQGAAVLAVMLGTELRRLHKLHAPKRGAGSHKSRNLSGFRSWPELVKQELGISDDSAGNYMQLAEAAKKRIPKFGPIAEEILSTPLRDLPPERRAYLAEQTRNVLPSTSANQLAIDWGLTKLPKLKGGKREAAGDGEELSEEEKAVDLWRPVVGAIAMELEAGSWAHLPDRGEVSRETLVGLAADLSAKLKTAAKDAAKKATKATADGDDQI